MYKVMRIWGALLLFVALFGCSNIESAIFHQEESPEMIFRYAENQAEDYPTTLGAYYFAELVSERTEGRIQIRVYHSAELGSETEVLEQLRFGGIDFARISLSQLAELYSAFNVLLLPYLYRNDEHMWAVLDSHIGERYLELAKELNLLGLSWYHAGARSFYTKSPVTRLEDLQGLNIRVQESGMMADMVRILGATPTPMAFGDVYSSLETGKMDGAENNWPSYESTSHYEVAPYFFLDEHARIPEMQIMSRVSMEKLSEQDLLILQECARESALYERELWKEREQVSEERIRSFGVQVSVPDPFEKQRLQETCAPIYDRYASDYLDVVDEILLMADNMT